MGISVNNSIPQAIKPGADQETTPSSKIFSQSQAAQLQQSNGRLEKFSTEMKAAFSNETDLQMIDHADASEFSGFEKLGFQVIPTEAEVKAFEKDFAKADLWLAKKEPNASITRTQLRAGADVKSDHVTGILENMINQGKMRKEQDTGYFKN